MTEARGGFRNSYGLAAGSNAFHAPVAVKQYEPTHSDPAHCDYPCHREKDCLLLFQMAKVRNELRVRASHGKNEEARRWASQHGMGEPILKLFLAEVASSSQ